MIKSEQEPQGPDSAPQVNREAVRLATRELESFLDEALEEPASPSDVPLADPSLADRVEPADPYIGLVVDHRYVVEHLLGQGGMGVVYRCHHRILGKKLAIKIIRGDVAQNPEAPQRFLLEAKAASAIGNEHIVDIIDFGALPDGAAYLVMELLLGLPLSELSKRAQRLSVGRIIAIASQVAEGLGDAHAAGIVHRDLKPDNLFVSERKGEDFVKILDFGVAQTARAEENRLTQAGTIVGTPHYMSPEQAAAKDVDHRGDIYALGVIMYELLAGRVPFDGPHYLAVLHQHLHAEPPPLPAELAVPRELASIIAKCLAKEPEQRYATMAELRADLAAVSPAFPAAVSHEAAWAATATAGSTLFIAPRDTADASGASERPATLLLRPIEPALVPPQVRGRARRLSWLVVFLTGMTAAWSFVAAHEEARPASASASAPASAAQREAPVTLTPAPRVAPLPLPSSLPDTRGPNPTEHAAPVEVVAPRAVTAPRPPTHEAAASPPSSPARASAPAARAARPPRAKPRAASKAADSDFINPWPKAR